MEMSGQLHVPAALPQGKSPWYTLDRRLGGPQSRSGHGGSFQKINNNKKIIIYLQLQVIKKL
jgi:hypothetical protein